jgi:hypothetical protein
MSRGRARPQLLRVEQTRSELVFGMPAPWRFPSVHRAVTRRGLGINSLLFQRIAIEARHECLVGVPNVKFRDAFPRSLRPSRYSLGG